MGDKHRKLTLSETTKIALRPLKALLGNKSLFLDLLEHTASIDAERISFNLGSRYFMLLKDPEDIGQILTAPIDKVGHSLYQADPVSLSGNNKLVTNSDGETWKQQRRKLAGFMSPKGLKSGFADEAKEFVADYVKSWEESSTIAVAQEASRLSLKYMFKASFNHELSNDDCDKLHLAADGMHRYLYWSVVNRGIVPKAVVRGATRVNKTTDLYNDLADKLVESYEKSSNEEREKNIFNFLLSEDDPKDQARATIKEMLVAGHFSVRTAFYWALHNLARHPEHQEIIRSESKLTEEMKMPSRPEREGNIPMSMKASLETLRLYPPFYMFLKETKTDFKGKEGLDLPAGTTVLVPPWIVQRDPKNYPNPNEFDPDANFAPHEIRNRSRYAFLPFGHGPHNCPGSGLTLQQMASTLTEICENYTLAPLNGDEDMPDVTADVFLKPENETMLRITPE